MSKKPDGWRNRAACLNADPELFSAVSKAGVHHPNAIAALKICEACPVQQECLAEAVNGINFAAIGVWGGTYINEHKGLANLARAREEAGVAGTNRDYTKDLLP